MRSGRNWAQASTSIAAVGALVVTALSLYLTNRQSAHQNSITEQGQITQRYTAAIDQLGADVEDVRLGGIYSLQRIMNNSPADQPTIVSVLSAFIRNHPPGNPRATTSNRPPTDIDAALAVLGGRNTAHDRYAFADLSNTDLSHLDLTHSDLSGVDLSGVDLRGAVLTGMDLSEADLYSANLDGANLDDAKLTGTQLWGTVLCSGTNPTKPALGYRCEPPKPPS